MGGKRYVPRDSRGDGRRISAFCLERPDPGLPTRGPVSSIYTACFVFDLRYNISCDRGSPPRRTRGEGERRPGRGSSIDDLVSMIEDIRSRIAGARIAGGEEGKASETGQQGEVRLDDLPRPPAPGMAAVVDARRSVDGRLGSCGCLSAAQGRRIRL